MDSIAKKEDVRLRRLSHFSVSGLFGEFDHEIPFSVNEHITALIGPNGMGKTACLKLINALFQQHWSVFQGTEFIEIIYLFNDGSQITVTKGQDNSDETEVSDTLDVCFRTTIIGIEHDDVWRPRSFDSIPARTRSLETYLPFLTRLSSKTYMHDHSRQIMTVHEVLEAYGDRIPDNVKRSMSDPPSGALAGLISEIDCHLIETQRLLVFTPEDARRSALAGSTLAIARKAQKLKEIIARELAVYASTSQSLDRSFPRRVLESVDVMPAEDLTTNLKSLDQTRRGLMEAGILDPEADDALPPFEVINESIAAVLNVYVKDTQDKLSVLAQLKKRIQLFIELINIRFFPKTVSVDKENGLTVKRNSVNNVPLEKLSSGEQHQLVLFFELLFELKSNALILIDEPELSLHVAWQKQFIPDLCRIIELNKFDVLLATHSPQLIGEWDDLVVELGDVENI